MLTIDSPHKISPNRVIFEKKFLSRKNMKNRTNSGFFIHFFLFQFFYILKNDYNDGLLRLVSISMFWPSYNVRRSAAEIVKCLSLTEPIMLLQHLMDLILTDLQTGYLDQVKFLF
jgi:hypothetical protein